MGLDMVFEMYRWSRQHKFLENIMQMFFGSGNKTVEFNVLRFIAIFTMEAANVKAILSLNHQSFGMANKPKEIDLLLGDGIFTNEGKAWHQSREMLRPSFARSQIADLDILEKHVSALIDNIPRDCSTIDLSKLFSQLTLSIAVEFLFGDRSNGCRSDTELASNEAFAQAWDRVSNFFETEEYTGRFWLWHEILDRLRMNPRFKRNCHELHGKHELSPWLLLLC